MRKIPDAELLSLACEFDMGPEPIVSHRYQWWLQFPKEANRHHVYVKNMGNPDDGPDRWGIFNDGNSCLNKDGEWQYQGLPSGREDNFYEFCRYSSVHEAIRYYRRWKRALEKWIKDELKKDPERKYFHYTECPSELLKF